MTENEMTHIEGCQIPGIPRMSEEEIQPEVPTMIRWIKHTLAVPWNYYVKRWLKKGYHLAVDSGVQTKPNDSAGSLKVGDQVRVRSWQEIEETLDPFKELKGCAFL